jgi:FlaA1/EpsC-like NDP-sugar epimerase
MIKKLLQDISNKYASKWLVMLFDLSIVAFTFIAAYVIRFNFIIDFDWVVMFKQIPFVFLAALISFIFVGSYKGVVRFTGFKDVINIIIGVNILATILIKSTFFSRR